MTTNNQERVIKLSLHPIDYSGNATDYRPNDVKISDFENVFTTLNYSPIIWKGPYRKKKNFQYATGFCVDIDEGMTIDEAEKILFKHNFNYALGTTRHCTKTEQRFRIFIPFNKKLYTYEQYLTAANEIDKLFGGKCDPKVFDGGRQLYGSGKMLYFRSCWTGKDYDVTHLIGFDLSNVKYGCGDWDDNLVVKDKNGKELSVKDIKVKTQIHCPFHDDSNPSAFIDYSKKSDNWYIRCSSTECNKTYWKTKFQKLLEERCEPYWSHMNKIYEMGIIGDTYHFKEIGEKKFYVFTENWTKESKGIAFEWLLKNHHLSNIIRIDYLGDPLAVNHTYAVKKDQGLIEVRYTALPVDVKDNQFIENYLDKMFGQYKEFIKQYMAVYTYTDFRKLPTLILVGERGVGKSIFAEMLAEIYPQRSQVWTVKEENFNPELQKKLLVADETVSSKKENYQNLKTISGRKYHSINEKFTPKYQVLNNVNVVILSNSLLPVYVEREELPTDVANNQFFVYEIKRFSGSIDAELDKKLKARLGYYVRSELKQVFDGLDMSKYRYSLPVPITPEEHKLFKSSISIAQMKADKFIQDLINKVSIGEFKEFADAGFVPVDAICEQLKISDIDKRSIVHNLRERGYLSVDDVDRICIKSDRQYCYSMTDKLKLKIKIDCIARNLVDQQAEKEVK